MEIEQVNANCTKPQLLNGQGKIQTSSRWKRKETIMLSQPYIKLDVQSILLKHPIFILNISQILQINGHFAAKI